VLLTEGAIVEKSAQPRAISVVPQPRPAETPQPPITPPPAPAQPAPETVDARERLLAPDNEAPKAESDLEAAVAALVATTPDGPLTLVVTGEGSRGALGVALMAARRLSLRASTVLIDLGMTQPWLSDVVERGSEDAEGFAGLGELVANSVGFEDVLHRDLSSRIDIIPPGREEVGPEDFQTVLAALKESYDFVIVHVSDWRTPLGRAALEGADGAVVCALQTRLPPMRERIQWAVGERRFILGEMPMQKREAIERAA
jgi:Mrp family chromosome partitioning ATPase